MTERALTETAEALLAFSQGVRALHTQHTGDKSWLTLDVSMAQFKALTAIIASGGTTARVLSDRLGIGPSAITPLVDKLVAQKLVTREPDASDRRVHWIRPTSKATALHDRLLTVGRAVFRELIQDLPDEELAVVHRAATILAAATQRSMKGKP